MSTDTTAYQGQFLYTDEQQRLAVFDLSQGKPIWSKSGIFWRPCWSPGGSDVVFTAASGSGVNRGVDLVFLSPFDGTERRVPLDPEMFEEGDPGSRCSISSTGDYVAIDAWGCMGGEYFVADAKTGKTVYLISAAEAMWAPDRNALGEAYCSEGRTISVEPGMWYELKITDIPSGESRTLFKDKPDHIIDLLGWADPDTMVYTERIATNADYLATTYDTTGKTYASSPFQPARMPNDIGKVVDCRGPYHGLWLLQVQYPETIIWLYDETKDTVIDAAHGYVLGWRPGQ